MRQAWPLVLSCQTTPEEFLLPNLGLWVLPSQERTASPR